MKYSVIIPIYNAEKTLRRCLDSLLPQLNNDIEVLLINDGSTDTSGEICIEFAEKCYSFRYFEQSNSGVSAARNKGLDNATGDYILFIDSDDYIDTEYFESLNNCLSKEKTDLLVFGAMFLNRNQNSIAIYKNEIHFGIEAVKQYTVLSKKQEMYSLWNKVFSRLIIEKYHIRFNTNISIGEDGAFIFKYILHTNKLVSLIKILYYVDEENIDSLSRKKREDLCNSLIEAHLSMYEELNRVSFDKKTSKLYHQLLSRAYYRSAYSCFLEISRWNCSNEEMKKEIEKVCLAYRNNRIKPVGIDSILLSVPVLWKLTILIRLMLKMKR